MWPDHNEFRILIQGFGSEKARAEVTIESSVEKGPEYISGKSTDSNAR